MKTIVSVILIALFAIACGKQGNEEKLEKGTPAYELAASLSEKIPFIDPETNNVLVNSSRFKITSGEVVKSMQVNLGARAQQLQTLDADRLKEIIHNNAQALADKELLLLAADKANIEVAPQEVDSLVNMQFTRAGGKESFMEILTKNNITLDFVRNEIHTGLVIQKYLDTVLAEETQVTDKEIQQAYNEDKTATVRHILLSTQGKSEEETEAVRAQMEDILKRAKNGEDFAKLAREYTEDPGSKENGGLYENFGRGQMVKPFEEAAFSVPVGEISDVVETRYGFHILKVIDRKKETRPLDEVRPELENQLERTKQNEAYQTHLEKLREEAQIEIVEF